MAVDEGTQYYIDTVRFYRRRQAEIRYRLVIRAYCDGYPYTSNPEDPEQTTGKWRKDLLNGPYSENDRIDRADGIDYMSNLALAKINNIIAGILPEDTRLTLNVPKGEDGEPVEIPEKAREELFRRLLYFGRRFDTGSPETDFMAWLDQVLVDLAKGGDGLILTGSTEAEGDEPGRIRYDFYNYETWAPEVDIHGEPVFYRVEWRFVDVDGEEKWYRRDYFPDHKLVYFDSPMEVPNFPENSPAVKQATALDATAGTMPRRMRIKDRSDENGVLKELGDYCVVDVYWDLGDIGDFRGKPEITIEDLPGIDADNELLNYLIKGTAYVSNPVLAAIDLEQARGEDGRPAVISREDYAPGAVVERSTSGDHQGKLTYPENLPGEFPNAETRKEIKATLMGCVPDIRPDIEGMRELSRLSGYAYQTILKSFNKLITRRRQYTIGKVLKALRLG